MTAREDRDDRCIKSGFMPFEDVSQIGALRLCFLYRYIEFQGRILYPVSATLCHETR